MSFSDCDRLLNNKCHWFSKYAVMLNIYWKNVRLKISNIKYLVQISNLRSFSECVGWERGVVRIVGCVLIVRIQTLLDQ